MRVGLVAAASAVMLTAIASVLPGQVSPRVYSPRESDYAPQIDLWLDQVSYRPGDRIAPHFVTEPGAFVTIVRVTSDGRLTVLYPRRPLEQQAYYRNQLVNDRVPLYLSNENRFQVAESRGTGFVFAIASFDKFNYDYYTSGGTWSEARLANDGRYGDPFEIVRRFVDRTLIGRSDYSLDYVSYEVLQNGPRSSYASRYNYNTYDDFYDSCMSAFGLRYTSYCRNAYPGYFGSIIVTQPGAPRPDVPTSGRNLAGKRIKPVTGDPVVDGAPSRPQVITEGRLPTYDPAEAAADAARRDRMSRHMEPRDRSPSQVEMRPVDRPAATPSPERAEPAQRPWFDRQPVVRTEPRVEQPRVEQPRIEQQRAEPRPQPVAQPRVEVRNEPPQPAPQPQATPRTTATPATKDNQN